MNHQRKPRPEQLERLLRVEGACARFEAACVAGEMPDVRGYLEVVDAADQAVLLEELLLLEWSYRADGGKGLGCAGEQDRFASMAGVVELAWRRWLSYQPDEDEGVTIYPSSNTVDPQPMPASRSAQVPAPPGYTSFALLGRGGMGEVWRAHDTRIRREVAIKLINAEATSPARLAWFRKEAEALGRLKHPAIVQVYAWEEHGGVPYLVMEHVCGGSLEDHLKKGPLPIEEAIRLVIALAQAVSFAHDKGIVHRDLKPANVLLDTPVPGERGVVNGMVAKISDFGLARLARQEDVVGEPAAETPTVVLGDGDSALKRTHPGALLGTPGYMAPEQATGEVDRIGPATDTWALGVILYRCVTGTLPFVGETLEELKAAMQAGAFVRIAVLRAGVPAEVEGICRWCWRCLPDERPNAMQLVAALERVTVKPERRLRRKSWVWWASVAASAAAVIIGIGALLVRPLGERPFEPPVEIREVRLRHFEIVKGKPVERGLLGNHTPRANAGDGVRVELDLAEPGYAYVLSFDVQGREELLWPIGVKNKADMYVEPPLAGNVVVPSGEPLQLRSGRDGDWYHAIVAVVSRQPLPSYNKWIGNRNAGTDWDQAPARFDGVFRIEGKQHQLIDAGKAVVLDNEDLRTIAQPLSNLSNSIQQPTGSRVVTLGFRVQSKLGGVALKERHQKDGMNNRVFHEAVIAGQSLQAKRQYAAAESIYRKALDKRIKELGSEGHEDVAQLQTELGHVLSEQGKLAEALQSYQHALSIVRIISKEDSQRTAVAMTNVAKALEKQEMYAEAQPLFRKALAINRQELGEDHQDSVTSLAHVATNLMSQGRNSEARPLLEMVLAANRVKWGEDHPETALSYSYLAAECYASGRFSHAQPLFGKALQIQQKVLGEEHPQTATSFHNLASALSSQGRYEQAQRLYEKSLALHRTIFSDEHPKTAQAYKDLANNLLRQNKFAQAAPLAQRALAIFRKILGEENTATVAAYESVAFSLSAQGKSGDAEALYRKALGIRLKILGENHPHTADTYNSLARCLLTQGKLGEALLFCQQALGTRSRHLGEYHPDTATSYYNAALVLDGQGSLPHAQRLFEHSLAIRRKMLGDDHHDTLDSYNRLGVNLWKQGQVKEAVRLWQVAVTSYEAGRLLATSSGFDRARFSMSRFQPHAALAVGLAHLGLPRSAWKHAEADLARGLLDDIGAAGLVGADAAALLAQVRVLRERTSLLQTQSSGTEEQRRLLTKLGEEREQLEQQLSGMIAKASSRLIYPLEEIQQTIPTDTALVLWIDVPELKEHWACIVRREGTPIWQKLFGSGAEQQWTTGDLQLPETAYRAARDRGSSPDRLQQLNSALNRQRIAPLDPHLTSTKTLPAVRRLLVVPTRDMAQVPVELLTDRYSVSYIPSGTLFARISRNHRPLQASPLLALGDPVFTKQANGIPTSTVANRLLTPVRGAEYARLPGTRLEVEMVTRLVPNSTKLLGSMASEQQLDRLNQTGELGRFRILHLATHGHLDHAFPEQSALILAQDQLPSPVDQAARGLKHHSGELTVGTILREWKLDADLVVLSTCETGLGQNAGGEGVLGFAHAFLQAGARSVVVARWQISDAATSVLMQRFYENLLGKRKNLEKPLPRAQALAEAKAWLRELPRNEAQLLIAPLFDGIGPRPLDRGKVVPIDPLSLATARVLPPGDRPFAHPYFWAAFVLIGDPD